MLDWRVVGTGDGTALGCEWRGGYALITDGNMSSPSEDCETCDVAIYDDSGEILECPTVLPATVDACKAAVAEYVKFFCLVS